MAEAAVEDGTLQKFYCHVCNVQFQDPSANFTCPHCADGFVEELQDTPGGNDETPEVDWEDTEVADNLMNAIPLELMEERRTRSRTEGNRPGRRYANRARIIRPRTLTRLASSNLRQQIPLDNVLQDFIVNLGVNWGGPANMQLFLGNPGDYAWGREGLDAIVSQLLNQMDSTGPPPVSKDVIDALPIVQVTDEQVKIKLQCSVCWEDFQLGEFVRQLPCLHIYHEPCIRPWLELHGTCPICRQNLINNEQSSDNNHDSGSSGGGATFGQQTLEEVTYLEEGKVREKRRLLPLAVPDKYCGLTETCTNPVTSQELHQTITEGGINYNLLRGIIQSPSSNSSNASSSSSLDHHGARTRSRSQSDAAM